MNESGIFTIFVGQAGVQIGNSFWELFCAEHAIDSSGFINDNQLQSENALSFFQQVSNAQYVPRSLMIDLEPTVIDEIKTGAFRDLYHPDMLINGYEDSGGNFARGFFTVGKLLMPRICDQLRKSLERDMTIIGVIVFRSLGGGTGSGLTSAIFDTLIDLPKITRIEVPIYPSPMICSSVVEPYNALLSEHFCMEDVDLGLLFDNEAMYELCGRNLATEKPSFATINRVVSQTMSCITSSLRFHSILNCDLNVLQTNLVPYPRIHFPISNFAPVLSADKISHHRLSVSDLTNLVFEPSNQLIKVDANSSKYMSCTMFYRGDISPYDVYAALRQIKSNRDICFVDWCPTGFKVSISNPAQVEIPNGVLAQPKSAVAMLTNTSSVARAWCRLNGKFQLLYIKKAFMHWYVSEGLDESEFQEAQANIASLVQDYVEAADEDFQCSYLGDSATDNDRNPQATFLDVNEMSVPRMSMANRSNAHLSQEGDTNSCQEPPSSTSLTSTFLAVAQGYMEPPTSNIVTSAVENTLDLRKQSPMCSVPDVYPIHQFIGLPTPSPMAVPRSPSTYTPEIPPRAKQRTHSLDTSVSRCSTSSSTGDQYRTSLVFKRTIAVPQKSISTSTISNSNASNLQKLFLSAKTRFKSTCKIFLKKPVILQFH